MKATIIFPEQLSTFNFETVDFTYDIDSKNGHLIITPFKKNDVIKQNNIGLEKWRLLPFNELDGTMALKKDYVGTVRLETSDTTLDFICAWVMDFDKKSITFSYDIVQRVFKNDI